MNKNEKKEYGEKLLEKTNKEHKEYVIMVLCIVIPVVIFVMILFYYFIMGGLE